MPSRAASLARNAICDAPVSTTSSKRRPSTRASVRKCPSPPGARLTLRELAALGEEATGAAASAAGDVAADPFRSTQRATRTPAESTVTAKMMNLPMNPQHFVNVGKESLPPHNFALTRQAQGPSVLVTMTEG